MKRSRDIVAALRRAFAKTRSVSGCRSMIRYSDELKRMAVAAVHEGIDRSTVLAATGVSEPSLIEWLKCFKPRSAEKKNGGESRREQRFKRLRVVGDSSPTTVSMVFGQGVRLEIPLELLSAELIRRLTASP